MQFNWSPGFGDPSLMGYLILALYVATALFAQGVAQSLNDKAHVNGPDLRIWRGLTLLLLVLGVNKQLDLQSGLAEVGRMLAQQQGWHEYRQVVQSGFLLAASAVAFMAAFVLRAWAKGASEPSRLALLGAIWLGVLVMIRAASYDSLDELLNSRILGMKWISILEMGGLALITRAAFRCGTDLRAGSRLAVRHA